MRISDWSSDVCSSDFQRREGRAVERRGRQVGDHRARRPGRSGDQGHRDAEQAKLGQFRRQQQSSEERRGGEEWGRTCKFWLAPYNSKKKIKKLRILIKLSICIRFTIHTHQIRR